MFGYAYHIDSNTLLLTPHRCGSSLTRGISNTTDKLLTESEIIDIVGPLDFDHPISTVNQFLSHPVFRNSNIIMVYREPAARYMSGLQMAISDEYSDNEIKEFVDFHMTSVESPDFTLNDSHLIPIISLQLLLYACFKNHVTLLPLREYSAFLKNLLGDDFYVQLTESKPASIGHVNNTTPDLPTNFAKILFDKVQNSVKFNYEVFSDWLSYDVEDYKFIELGKLNINSLHYYLEESINSRMIRRDPKLISAYRDSCAFIPPNLRHIVESALAETQ